MVINREDPVQPPPVETSWARIDAWLAEHAPETLRAFRPPPSKEEIAEAEGELGVTFCPDLVASPLCRRVHGRFPSRGDGYHPGRPPGPGARYNGAEALRRFVRYPLVAGGMAVLHARLSPDWCDEVLTDLAAVRAETPGSP
ncbi:hypothetical protein ACWF94_16770 [Streptomyces sp. NPDC055078]